MLIRLLQNRFYWLVLLASWLMLGGLSLAWNLHRLDHSIRDIALERAKIMFEMVRQTKISPTLMSSDPDIFRSQVFEDIGYRVVSARPMNPHNLADIWEERRLEGFRSPEDYAFDEQGQEGRRVFRYLGPIFMEEVCLQCHGGEGMKVGDLRGAISVTVKRRPIYNAQSETRHIIWYIHLGGILLLSLSSVFLMGQLRTHWSLLTEARDQVNQKQAFLRSITDTMGEGFLVIDSSNKVAYANPESEWLLGWDAEEMLGRRWEELLYSAAAPAADIRSSALYQTLRDGLTRREEDRFIHKDGREITVSYAVSAMLEKGKAGGVVLTFEDISERRKFEEERRRLERQLNQMHKVEAVGQLAGGIAHEINTPIQYIGDNLRFLKETAQDVNRLLEAYGELLSQAEQSGLLKAQVEKVKEISAEIDFDYLKEESPKSIQQSLSGAEQVAHIVRAMKEFAHPGSKQMAAADLNRIIDNAVAVCRNEWKYVADTETRLATDLPEVLCVSGEISQVMLNLIVNAAHAVEEAKREGKGKITISSRVVGKAAEVRIADTGTGIPESVRDSVFNPFFTTKDVGKGTGQGLAIAQDIVVSKHHGELFFETKVGVGTTFIMRLPLVGRSQDTSSDR